uniref:WD repeat domain 60 n=1 Tax=Stegastes partitus TaxID=144197 RepID=A0A3B5BEE2_9TELE
IRLDSYQSSKLHKNKDSGDHYARRRDDNERKHRGEESRERRHRDPEKESRREREKPRERESTRERRDEDKKDRYTERRKEASQDRRGDKERDREKRRERDRYIDENKHGDVYSENRDRRRDREEKYERERDKERHRDKEKERVRERERERHNEEGRDKRREDRDKERRREERDREHRSERERRRHEESGERRKDPSEKHHREERDRHRERERHNNDYEDKRNDKKIQERHGDRKHSERKEERGKHVALCTRRLACVQDQGFHVMSVFLSSLFQKTEKNIKRTEKEDTKKEGIIANEGEDEKELLHREVDEEREELSAQRRKEIEAIQRAMDEENERVGTVQSIQSTSREEEDRSKWSKASQRGKFIDFVAAKQREVSKKVATKQKKRSTELLRLIDLDFSMTVSVFDLPPVNEYDMYIRNFGTVNTKQAYVQCNEDNADRDIQTEEIEMCEKWTQHPPEHSGACGGKTTSNSFSDSFLMNFDSQRLTAFLRSASQVMVVLLEEDQAERKSLRKLKSQTDTLSFSDGSLQLNTQLPFLYGRQISLLHFSQVQRHTMMSVHMPTTKPSAVRLDSCTIICIWNIWEPSRPQKVLVYESEVQCCCFSPGKAILVFAGTSVGSVALWDLREHSSNHYRLKIGEDEWTFRQPTFSTGTPPLVYNVLYVFSHSQLSLCLLNVILFHNPESSGLSFQLASLDESGVLNFWVGWTTKYILHVFPLQQRFRTVFEKRVPSLRDTMKTGPLQSLLLKFLPTDSSHFFIGTNMGLVNHGTSHGLKAPPKFYRCQEAGLRPVDVTSMHFSPFRQHLFLVGCGDGSIRLHAVSHEQPLAEWTDGTAGEPVVSLQWAQTRPTVFCALDAASNLHIWDLLKNDTRPVVTERMNADRVTAMVLFGDSGQQNTYSGIVLAHESGKIEMQYFTRNLTVSSSAEEEKLESMMTEAF